MATLKLNKEEIGNMIDEIISEKMKQIKESKNSIGNKEDKLQKYINENVVNWAKTVVESKNTNPRLDSLVNEAIGEYIEEKKAEDKKINQFKAKLMENIDNIVDEVFECIRKS